MRGHAIIFGSIVAMTVVLALIYFGSPDAYKDEIISRLAIILVPLMAYPFVYIWFLLKTPADLDRELRSKNAAITSQLQARNEGKLISWCLTQLIHDGQDLAHMRIEESGLDDLKGKIDAWGVRSFNFLRHSVSTQDATAFRVVSFKLHTKFNFATNDAHNWIINEITERISVLKEVNDRYKEYWSIIRDDQLIVVKAHLEAVNR